jgi:hypothetical protein
MAPTSRAPTYGNVKEDVSFGLAQSQVITALALQFRKCSLTNASDLPPNWNQRAYVPDSRWTNGCPLAIGFDTNQSRDCPQRRPQRTAVQSSGYNELTAPLGVQHPHGLLPYRLRLLGVLAGDADNELAIFEIVLFNRGVSRQWRLRTSRLKSFPRTSGFVTNWTSALLNRRTSRQPGYLSNNLAALNGGPVFGRTIIASQGRPG